MIKKCIDGNYTLNYYIEQYNNVKNYFYNLSSNKLTVNFNFYNAQINESSLIFSTYPIADNWEELNEYSLLKYFNNAQLIYGKKCDKAVKIVQYACLSKAENDRLGWPHAMQHYTANIYDNFIIVPHQVEYLVLCHEFLHVLKCQDLYFKDSVRGSFEDIMSCVYTSETTTNAYYKTKLGWIDESSYEDNICTGVEKISKPGRYKIYMPDVKNQTIAYKFGETLFENFYIETRYDGYYKYLIVNRVNQAVNHTNCTISSSEKDRAFFLTLAVCQNRSINTEISNEIKYSNGDIAPYSIGNIYYGSNYIEFDFCTSSNFNNLGQVQVVDSNNRPVQFVEVYFNNKFIGLTDNNGLASVSLVDNYELKFVKGSTSTTYKIDNPNFKVNFMRFTFNETKTYSVNVNFFVNSPPTNIFDNYYYAPPHTNFNTVCPELDIFVNDNLVWNGQYSKNISLTLQDGDTIKIYSVYRNGSPRNPIFYGESEKYYFNASAQRLTSQNGQKTIYFVNQNYFNIDLSIDACWYNFGIYVENNINKIAGIKNIAAFNSITNSWESLYYFGYDVNTNIMPVYLPIYYSKVCVEYQNYYETNSVVFEINNKQTYYTTMIKQSFIQDGLDFFANLFK